MRVDAADVWPLPGTEVAGERLKANGIAFVMLNRKTASPELRQYVERVLPLTMVAQSGDHALYVTSSNGRQ